MYCSVLDYLEETAARFPEKIAFEDLNKSLSFSELVKEAKAVGTYIAEKQMQGTPVVVYMEKGVSNIAAFLGAAYAGCFYVPIDAHMPFERVRLIVECLQPEFFICDDSTLEKAQTFLGAGNTVSYSKVNEQEINEELLKKIRCGIKTTDLLYVLFTSGSTGIPKGVTISHLAVMDFMEWICSKYKFDDSSVFCSQAPFYFDASVPDLYIPLKTGATVYIPPKSYYTFPKKVLQFIEEHQINTLVWVPSALCNVVNCRAFDVCVPTSVKTVIFCGEVMPCKHLNVWRRYIPDALYVNMYGPTEATYACTYYNIEKDFTDEDKLPLGRACENSKIVLMTEDGKQSRRGEAGEICVLGQCLSNGYYNAWENTDKVFVQNPINTKHIEMMYKTGDLAYEDENGNLIFLGRKDFQIKRLGHRIELGEIENTILAVNGIKNGCCLFDEKSSDIIAVYVGETEEKELDIFIGGKLPSYMKPTRYIRLDSMPMNLNGKIDRVKLRQEYIEGGR